MDKPDHIRKIRSFVRREGRLTHGQQDALENLWPVYGIPNGAQQIDFKALFGNGHPVILEIGFGNGESLAHMAAEMPENNYIGIEVHRPGVGHLLKLIDEKGLTNLRLMSDDAVDILTRQIPVSSLSGVQLFFPDPWHKKKHHKRRIVQPEFVRLLASRLRSGGFFHMATDWQDYAVHMLEVMQASNDFDNCSESGDYVPRPGHRPITKFERRGHRLGHGVWDLIFTRK
jgi:tRNA (guanine-N7-)-methyltransferase